jgi:superfamily II DNA or RNA helicase
LIINGKKYSKIFCDIPNNPYLCILKLNKMDYLVDGLGFDTAKEQYFTNTYAWQYIIPDAKKSKTFIGKSGITKYDVNTAMGEASPTRGRQFHQLALWGYEADRKYIKKGTTQEQAIEIVKKMDYFFKDDMVEIGWNLRHNKVSREIGTEFYEGPSETWLETIKQKWNEAFIKANQLVIGEVDGQDLGDMSVMGSQGVVTEQINEVLNKHKKVRAIIPCGYGKGFLEFRGVYKFDKAKKNKIIVYYCHNIPATKQLSVKHAEYSDGTIYQGTMNRYVVCSEKKYVKGQASFGIENYSATDGKLKDIIKEALLSKQRTAFYVNNKSAGEFNDTFRTIANQVRYTKKPFAFIDEEQEFCGHISSSKTDAILNPIAEYQVSFTATERRRGTDTNEDRIYNDDIKHFGEIAVEITPSETITEGRSCPIHFKTIEVSENNQLMRQIGVNGIIESVFGDETSAAVRGRMLRAIVCLVKSIKEEDKTHPLLVTSLIVDTENAIILINKLIEHGIIPNDYVVVRGLRQDGLDATKRFNLLEKGIMVGSPWLVTGIDAPNIDALVPTYDMGSEITATQFIGRGQRPVDDKELSVYIPIDPSETFIPSMLRVANNFILGENSHNIGRNTILEEGEEILGSIQRRRITSDIDREVNMNAAYRNYWDNIYDDLTTNEIGTAKSYYDEFNNITPESIEELYKKYENRFFKELNISSSNASIGKARELGIHDLLIKKYNIIYLHKHGEKDYSVLLTCKNNEEASKKYNAELVSIWKSKDKELIKKYTGHFERLRIKEYTDDMLNNFFNSLPSDVYPENIGTTKCKRLGLIYNKEYDSQYRILFNRGKDKWYKKILNKWGDKVPMIFLNDEDKLKKVKREIKTCKNYSEWFNNYKSSHDGILNKLNRYDLVDKLPRDVNKKHTKENVIKMLKKYKGKFPNEFRKDHNAEWIWVRKNKLEKELYKDLKHDPRRKQKI